jgi:hypothetical protein
MRTDGYDEIINVVDFCYDDGFLDFNLTNC